MSTHGRRGFKHAFLGSVTERTLRASPVPVLATKGSGLPPGPLKKILLPTDFSDYSRHAQHLACALAKRSGAHIDVVHVLNEIPEYLSYDSAEARNYESQARAIAGEHLDSVGKQIENSNLSTKTHLCKGVPADVIAQAADRLGSNLIVMGTHGHTGFTHTMLGSVAERTLRLAPCSVLTTHGPEAAPSQAD
jgi:nucleotide-binding universal stress UspA family protein